MPRYNRDDWPPHFIVFEIICPECDRSCWANKPKATYCCITCRVHAFKKRQALLEAVIPESCIEADHRPDVPKASEKNTIENEKPLIIEALAHLPEADSGFTSFRKSPASEEIYYAMVNSEGRITSRIYSSQTPYKGEGKVSVWYWGQLVQIPCEDLEEHMRSMEKQRRQARIFGSSAPPGER